MLADLEEVAEAGRAVTEALVLPGPTDVVRAFLEGRAGATLRAYRKDLEDFAAFAGASVDGAARRLLAHGPGAANGLALAYRSHLVSRGLQAATVNRRLAALRSLVKLARTLGVVAFALDVPNVRAAAYRDTRGPGVDGYQKLLAAARRTPGPKGLRDVAILRLLFDLALRRQEVVSLDIGHFDRQGGTLEVMGKGQTQRQRVTLPEPTQRALEAWMAVRGDAGAPLFVNFDRAGRQGRLTGTGLYLMIRSLGTAAGIKARPHGLRHAGITAALDLTQGNLRAVQRFSRHKDVRILALYDDNRADLGGEVARLVAAAE
ncbi:MAG: tyrosine-type recombinase/integrase [Bryobacterales bacterium]|nr:tyrosine-type recombinase/integrase [Bryobacterales bacterium]